MRCSDVFRFSMPPDCEWRLCVLFAVTGLALTAGLALFYMRHPLKQLISAMPLKKRLEEFMASQDTTKTGHVWRRRLIPLVGVLLLSAVLLIPWNASVGNYGTLIAIPQREAIIRAPADGTLIQLNVQPGALVAGDNVVGRMADLRLDEQLAQSEAELARTTAEQNRLLGELRGTEELAARAEAQWNQRQREFSEADAELRQIGVRLPPSLGALQAEIDSRRTRVQEAVIRQQRATKLFAEGLVARSELDAASAGASALSMEWTEARERLEAALIEHRRHRDRSATEMDVARRDLGAQRVLMDKLKTELESTHGLIRVLEQRRDILQRKRAQFDLVTPRPGTIFGDDLPSAVGRYFSQGAEILRVADTSELLLRIQVPEREMGDVCVGCRVRLKTRSFPDRAFYGVVSNIGGQSEKDQYGQAAYRVELTIENSNGLLRPGMTAFARIDFGRQTIGRIALHKIKQALRPELWLL
jgi:multidrug resistance efflux pump